VVDSKTPAFHEGEVAALLAVIDPSTPVGQRDRAFLATLAYTVARISNVIGLAVVDYFPSGKRWLLRFKEKGDKETELPVHHQLEQILDDYLPEHYSAHSFRAAGFTKFLENGGSLKVAQRIAGHADSGTTKLYARRAEKLLVEDMKRIRY